MEKRAWIAQHPNGRWLILMPQEDLKGWWQQIGSFPDYRAAANHAVSIDLKVEERSKVKLQKKRIPSKPRRITPRLIWIIAYLSRLRDQIAQGELSMQDMAEDCKVSHAGFIYNINVLADLGFVRVIYRNQGQRMRFDLTQEGIDQLDAYKAANPSVPIGPHNAEQST